MKTPDDEHMEKPAPAPKKKKRRSADVIAAEKKAWLERYEWGGALRAIEHLGSASESIAKADHALADSGKEEAMSTLDTTALLGTIDDVATAIREIVPAHIK